jgi:hypothetical protein
MLRYVGLIDERSFIDYLLLSEITNNADSYHFNTCCPHYLSAPLTSPPTLRCHTAALALDSPAHVHRVALVLWLAALGTVALGVCAHLKRLG